MAYSDVQFHKDLINGLDAVVKSLNGIRSELRTLNETTKKFESGFYVPVYGEPRREFIFNTHEVECVNPEEEEVEE